MIPLFPKEQKKDENDQKISCARQVKNNLDDSIIGKRNEKASAVFSAARKNENKTIEKNQKVANR